MFISPKLLYEKLGVVPWYYEQRNNSLVVSRSFTSHQGFTFGELSNIATNSASVEYLSHEERPPKKTWILKHAEHIKNKQLDFLKVTQNLPEDSGFVNYQNCGSTGMNNQEWLLDVANTKDIWDRALQNLKKY